MADPSHPKTGFPPWTKRALRKRKPAHYRLSRETWAIILKEYREGATAKELVAKWRVSMHGLRKKITVRKSTKRDHGDAQAIAFAEAYEAAQAAAEPEALAERLFEDDPDEDQTVASPAALALQATLASGRAMRGRLWTEAKALTGLAESYRRLSKAEAAAKAAESQVEQESRWPSSFEEEEDMRDDLYRRLVVLAGQIDEEELLETAEAMAASMGVAIGEASEHSDRPVWGRWGRDE